MARTQTPLEAARSFADTLDGLPGGPEEPADLIAAGLFFAQLSQAESLERIAGRLDSFADYDGDEVHVVVRSNPAYD